MTRRIVEQARSPRIATRSIPTPSTSGRRAKVRPFEADPAARSEATTEVHFRSSAACCAAVGYIRAVACVAHPARGHTIGLVGESGSGKTTLGLALLRLEGSKGGIQFDKQDLQALSQREIRPLRRQMRIVFQDPYSSLSPRMSVGEIVGEGLQVHRIGSEPSAVPDRPACLSRFGPGARERFLHEFSAATPRIARPRPGAEAQAERARDHRRST